MQKDWTPGAANLETEIICDWWKQESTGEEFGDEANSLSEE